MVRRQRIDYEKALPFNVTPDKMKRIVNGEITAMYLRCEMISKAARVMDYAKIGSVRDEDGGFCPHRGEWMERVEFDGRNGAYAKYQSGRLKCVDTIPMLSRADTYYLTEYGAHLESYGLPEHTLYAIDQMPPSPPFSLPIVTITDLGQTRKVKWRVLKNRAYARYFITVADVVIKPVLDVTEDEALAMGFLPTEYPIQLGDGLTLLVDEGKTARNAFFLDYYDRAGEELRNDPYIYYIEFDLHRR